MSASLTTSGPWGLALTIEGYGSTLGQWRYARAQAPSWDSDNLYQPSTLVSWPSQIGSEIDWREGTVRQSAATFQLRRTSRTLADLWTQTEPFVAAAQNAVGSSGTTITLDATTLAGTVVFWEREAILLGVHAGAGVYTGCTRGYLGTQATRHGDGDYPDLEVFARVHPSTRKARIVKLIRVPASATGYGDEGLLWIGVLHKTTSNGTTFNVQTREPLQLVASAPLMERPARWRSTAPAWPTRPAAGYGTGSTAKTLAVQESSGRVAVVPYVQGAGLGPGWRLLLDQATQVGDFPPPERDAQAQLGEWREVLSTHPAQPPSDPAPDNLTLPLSQSPAQLVLQLLTSTRNYSTPGGNGNFDTGIDLVAGSIPAQLVDEDAILEWGRIAAPLAVDNLWLGLGGPEKLGEVIRKILWPLGAVLAPGQNGKLRIVSLADAPPYALSAQITQAQILSVGPVQDSQVEDLIDAVTVEYGLIPGSGVSTDSTLDASLSRRLPPGQDSELHVDASYYSGLTDARRAALDLLFRFRQAPPVVSLACLPTADHWPGSVVRVTHPLLLGDGSVGWTSQVCLVAGRRDLYDGPDLAQGGVGRREIQLTLLWVGAIYARQGLIAPSARVVSWAAGSLTITAEANAYASASNPYLDRDSAGFAVGDVIQIVDEFGTVITATATVAAVGVNTIQLTAAPGTAPAAGDVVRPAAWTSQAASQQASWAAIADGNDELGGESGYGYPVG